MGKTMTFYETLKAWADSKRGDPEYRYDVDHFDRNDGNFYRPDKKDPDEWHVCTCCGKPETRMLNYKSWVTEKLCHTCHHWKTKDFSDPACLIIDGKTYGDGGRKPDGTKFLGFAGREFLILSHRLDKFISTNNLWSGGEIPKRFSTGDNAEFISSTKTWEELAYFKVLYSDMPQSIADHFAKIEKDKKRAEEYEERRKRSEAAGKGLECPF